MLALQLVWVHAEACPHCPVSALQAQLLRRQQRRGMAIRPHWRCWHLSGPVHGEALAGLGVARAWGEDHQAHLAQKCWKMEGNTLGG